MDRSEARSHVQEGLPEPDTEHKLVLTRTAQEALTNAQKHSGASRVELRLGFDGEAYRARVPGQARPPAADAPLIPGAASGFGLGNLRARAAAFGGSVELRPAEGGGALLRLRLPHLIGEGGQGWSRELALAYASSSSTTSSS